MKLNGASHRATKGVYPVQDLRDAFLTFSSPQFLLSYLFILFPPIFCRSFLPLVSYLFFSLFRSASRLLWSEL